MREDPSTPPRNDDTTFSQRVGQVETRKLKVQGRGAQDIWSGLGTFGLVGWSVAIPTVLGVLFGASIDRHFPGVHSWTLSFLIIGLFLGCFNAWHWVSKEEKKIHGDEDK